MAAIKVTKEIINVVFSMNIVGLNGMIEGEKPWQQSSTARFAMARESAASLANRIKVTEGSMPILIVPTAVSTSPGKPFLYFYSVGRLKSAGAGFELKFRQNFGDPCQTARFLYFQLSLRESDALARSGCTIRVLPVLDDL